MTSFYQDFLPLVAGGYSVDMEKTTIEFCGNEKANKAGLLVFCFSTIVVEESVESIAYIYNEKLMVLYIVRVKDLLFSCNRTLR